MDNNKYKEMIKEIVPKENKIRNYVVAFLVGGLIGLIGEIIVLILNKKFNITYKDSTSIMIVLLIFVASLSTALGFFDTLVQKAGCGLIVPITGFAHAMTSSMLEYKKEGLVTGIGSNAFKLTGSVILYGVVCAYFFGIIRFLFFGG